MIKNLKLAAKFLGEDVEIYSEINSYIKDTYLDDYRRAQVRFNPHEETGFHWLNKLEKKLSPTQHDSYTRLIMKKWCGENTLNMEGKTLSYLLQWLTYKQEFRFECIIEVLEGK